MQRVPRRVVVTRECDTCYCPAAAPHTLCVSCVRAPRAVPFSALDCVDDDGTTCGACRALLCPLHATPEQRARRRCTRCFDANSMASESMASEEEEESEQEQVTTPLSYRHAFGIEYDSAPDSLDDVDAQEEEERHDFETAQLMERAFIEWLLGFTDDDGSRRKRRRLSAHANHNNKPYTLAPSDSLPPTVDTCSICLDTWPQATPVAVMKCHPAHVFHPTCIDHWLLREAATCPLCQKNFACT